MVTALLGILAAAVPSTISISVAAEVQEAVQDSPAARADGTTWEYVAEVRGRVVGVEDDGLLRVEVVGDVRPSSGDSAKFVQLLGELDPLPAGTGQVVSVQGSIARVKVLTGAPHPGITAIIAVSNPISAADLTHLAKALSELAPRLGNSYPGVTRAFAALTEQASGGPSPGAPSDEVWAARAFILLRVIREQETLGWDLSTTLTRMGVFRGETLGTSCTLFTGDPPYPAAETEVAIDRRLRKPIKEQGAAILAAWRLLQAEGREPLSRFAASRYSHDDDPVGKDIFVERFQERLNALADLADQFSRARRAAEIALDEVVGVLDDPFEGASTQACGAAIRAVFDLSGAVARLTAEAEMAAGFVSFE